MRREPFLKPALFPCVERGLEEPFRAPLSAAYGG
jgi:hypothetical protein